MIPFSGDAIRQSHVPRTYKISTFLGRVQNGYIYVRTHKTRGCRSDGKTQDT